MAIPAGSTAGSTAVSTAGAGAAGPDDDERLSRRDLLVLKLELLRQRRAVSPVTVGAQRATRSTR
jgi:hypothetical protein